MSFFPLGLDVTLIWTYVEYHAKASLYAEAHHPKMC